MPAMVPAQEAGWLALLEISARIPEGWSLVGGQMVHLHCVERGQFPPRPTTDLDTVLDVRSHPTVLRDFTQVLVDIGFASAGQSHQGHQHRWTRGEAQIDILIPRHLGERAEKRTGVTGGTTIAAPGTQQALDRTERLEVEVSGTTGWVRRPSLLGALVGKAATTQILIDGAAERHLADFATLAALLRVADLRGQEFSKLDANYLGNMIYQVTEAGIEVDGSVRGIRMLKQALGAND